MDVDQMPRKGEDTASALMRDQRDLAIACLVLAITIAVALVLTNFGPVPVETISAEKTVKEHRTLLEQNNEVLRTNQRVLDEDRAALDRIKKALAQAGK